MSRGTYTMDVPKVVRVPGQIVAHKGRVCDIVRLECRAILRDRETGKLRMAKLSDLYEPRRGK